MTPPMNCDSQPTTSSPGPPPQPAGFWLRAGAFCLDWLLLTVAGYLLWGSDVVRTGASPFVFRINFQNTQLLLPLGYYLGFWIWRGATPGKMLCRLEIRAAGHGRLRPGQAVLRLLAYLPSFFLFGLGFLWIAFDKDKQGWHDKIAGTVVVRRQRS